MKCPVCENTDLLMTERQGVEIDYCPSCRGIWLDRGELDKIIEKSSPETSQNQPSANRERQESSASHDKHDDHHDDYRNDEKKKKKGGFLGDLMDF